MTPTVPKVRRRWLWIVTTVVYLVVAVLVWFLGSWLDLRGASLWILRVALWLLALIAAVVVVWFFAGPDAGAGGEGGARAGGGDDLDTVLAAAAARLAAAKSASGAKAGPRTLRTWPLVVVLGPVGSTKTTAVVYSGLEPDLLAGEVFHGQGIGSTPVANLWYTHHTVLLEAGGKLAADPGRFARLVRRIRPRTLKATLTGRPQAARAALVCFSCEELLKPESLQAVPQAARELRSELTQLAQGFGVQLPVYALFTKADKIPHFAEFVAHLSRDEVPQTLGATLRWPTSGSAGLYADREFQRLNTAFDRLLAQLATKRLELLARAADTEEQAGAYEFPRELRKTVPATIQFLVDLCRPSQLAVSPVLRGFYYTGVRAVVVSDAAPVRAAPAGAPGRVAATQVFVDSGAAFAAAPTPTVSGSRRMPQWLFLGTLLRDVVLRDRAPAAVAAGARSVAVLRRVGLSLVAVLALIGALWSTVQYAKNERAVAAARALATVVASETELPSVETLGRLETLRAHLGRLAGSWRWWWYKGSGLYPTLRGIYQERFDKILLAPARLSLLRALDSLPDAPNATAQYGRAYEDLKAYLMITSHPDQLAESFVVPVLMEHWLNGRQLDPERTELARRQYEFYATLLCRAAKCGSEEDARLVTRTRGFLGKFAGTERIYQLMASEVSGQIPPVEFHRRFPGAAGFVVDNYEIPGAFTDRGWPAMQDALKHVDRFFQADDWVLGESQHVSLDRAKLVSDLRTMYVADYIRRWEAFLGAAAVVPYGSVTDASRKLAQLGANQSPLLELLALVSQNTKADSQTVGAAFQPVHAVIPPGPTDRFVVEANQPYVGALNALQAIVDQAASAPPATAQTLASQTLDAARNARGAVGQLALKFSVTGDAGAVGTQVRTLLEQPIERVEHLLGRLPVTALNDRGASFCRSFGSLLGKYPFKADAPVEASLADVGAMFAPTNGALWQFYNEALQQVLVKEGSQYVPKPGGPAVPTSTFVRFFNRIAAVTDALWPGGATAPQFDFTLKLSASEAVPSASFSIDGQQRRFTRTFTAAQRYSWVGATARDVRLSADVRGRDETLLAYDGTWALFKLLQRARWEAVGITSVVQWVVPMAGTQVPLEAELNLGPARPILKGDYFVGMGCVSQIVQ